MMENKIGIEEIKKALEAMGSGFIGLQDVDWHVVAKEFTDLDSTERKELLMMGVEILLKLIGIAVEYKGIIRLLLKFIK